MIEGQIYFSNCKGKEVTSACYGTILEGFLCVFFLIHVAYRCFIPPIKTAFKGCLILVRSPGILSFMSVMFIDAKSFSKKLEHLNFFETRGKSNYISSLFPPKSHIFALKSQSLEKVKKIYAKFWQILRNISKHCAI